MKRCTDPSFKYTPVADQGDGYLKKKFDEIREELRRKDAELRLNRVINIKVRK